ncbi:hypothetical protein IB286_14240 [Spongiibacter sp. KMU-158]|uniref:Uncharacterized protein n=1 Tax=Spongiibacter pelagi TaxID=2760804 RepID=A0A927C2M3_9GAMM|nr:hypothetical protein [Spongiibacter pelagi]MBD2860158.1 hypothetical protein [Spongiibacter pelagi]|tara:strand:- start:80 stop:460 length:381 start_codon:yes stop_codon:yes gene_type:complete
MNIDKLQKQLDGEVKLLEKKAKFITELNVLMKKHGQTDASLLEILSSTSSTEASTPKRGRLAKKAAPAQAKAAPKKARKKPPARPERTFKDPKSGKTLKTRAPQVNKQIKAWAQAAKKTWQELEVK